VTATAGHRRGGAAIRRDLLFFSRTPERMAGVIGQFSDRTGNPDEAQLFYDRLAAGDRRARCATR
jgi:hypothetical protein